MSDPEVSDAIRVIHRNSPASQEYDDKSLVGRLQEERVFDSAEYRALEAALVCVSGQDELAFEEDRHVFGIYRQLALDFACHLSPNDVYDIVNLETDKAVELMNRIGFVFQCYFDRAVPDVDEWDDDAYEAAMAEALRKEPNPHPDWVTRGKTIKELITQLGTFEDGEREVRMSFGMGATHYPIALIFQMGDRCVVLEAGELTAETGASDSQ